MNWSVFFTYLAAYCSACRISAVQSSPLLQNRDRAAVLLNPSPPGESPPFSPWRQQRGAGSNTLYPQRPPPSRQPHQVLDIPATLAKSVQTWSSAATAIPDMSIGRASNISLITTAQLSTSSPCPTQSIASISALGLSSASKASTLPTTMHTAPSARQSSSISTPGSPLSPDRSPTPSTIRPSTTAELRLPLINGLRSDKTHVYVTGLDSQGQVVMLTTGGQFHYLSSSTGSEPEPVTADVSIPIDGYGKETQLIIPDYISSARVWFVDGFLTFSVVNSDVGPALVTPTAANEADASYQLNWGFVELTFNAEFGLFANVSYVDYVGLATSLQLKANSGVQTVLGIPPSGLHKLCEKLKTKAAADGEAWGELCVYDSSGRLLRVNSPATAIASTNSTAFATYWDGYIASVWALYARRSLLVDTQNGNGQVACNVQSGSLVCAGDNRPYSQPSAQDIFGCASGPFAVLESDNDIHKAVVPRLCAAFHRATLHLPGGSVQPSLPPTRYYTSKTANWYSGFVHEIETDGKGYAFPYDDVTPAKRYNAAGAVAAADVQSLTVAIGGATFE